MNILDFAKRLSETTGCDVKGFQSFAERPEEKRKMEEILTHEGTLLDTEQFLTGAVKPPGLVVAYLNHQTDQTVLFEMNAEVSSRWRER